MRIILCLAGIWIAACPGSTWASPAWTDTLGRDGRKTVCLAGEVLETPFHAHSRDWMIAGGIAAGAVLTTVFDSDVRREVRSWHQGWLKTVDDVGHNYQSVILYLGTTAAFWVGGYASDKPEVRRIGSELVTAFALSQAGTQLVKHVAGRSRPYTGDGPRHFSGPTLRNSHLSFWSGDATTAFALASVLSAEARRPVVTVLLYGLASTTAFQRIHTDNHWLSDVVCGAVWSSAVGMATVKQNRRIATGFDGSRISLRFSF